VTNSIDHPAIEQAREEDLSDGYAAAAEHIRSAEEAIETLEQERHVSVRIEADLQRLERVHKLFAPEMTQTQPFCTFAQAAVGLREHVLLARKKEVESLCDALIKGEFHTPYSSDLISLKYKLIEVERLLLQLEQLGV
jgi:hypothetical protein